MTSTETEHHPSRPNCIRALDGGGVDRRTGMSAFGMPSKVTRQPSQSQSRTGLKSGLIFVVETPSPLRRHIAW
jgi:hypothetical protein